MQVIADSAGAVQVTVQVTFDVFGENLNQNCQNLGRKVAKVLKNCIGNHESACSAAYY